MIHLPSFVWVLISRIKTWSTCKNAKLLGPQVLVTNTAKADHMWSSSAEWPFLATCLDQKAVQVAGPERLIGVRV